MKAMKFAMPLSFFWSMTQQQPYQIILLSIIIGLIFHGTTCAETLFDIGWMRQIGTTGEDKSYSIAVDASGNIYITGATNDSLFDTNAGNEDVFLTKYDPTGNCLWSRQIGSSATDVSYALTVDTTGNVYISGCSSTLGGSNVGGCDDFLIQYDAEGNQGWSQRVGSQKDDSSQAIAVDPSGNIYISGKSRGKIGGTTNKGGDDTFLSKFNATGTCLWTRSKGTTFNDESNAVTVDASGNVYISGYTRGILGGPNSGGCDAFLFKYDETGKELWLRPVQFGTSGDDYSNSMTVDASGNIYITGYTTGSLDGTNAGGEDVFLRKYDGAGNCLWGRQFGTPDNDKSYCVAVNSLDHIYISGVTSGTFDNSINAGGEDAFLICYDTDGTLLWSRQIGTEGNDVSRSVAIDASGNPCITGYTNGCFTGTNAEGNDAFIIKFQQDTCILLVPGDANRDNKVDVGDLGILAANYGQSNASVEQGDFNKDGIVDVGDLGILAANYGYGTPGTVTNFNADYARAFGETVDEDNSVDNDINGTDNSACSALGLPLMVGVVLACLFSSGLKIEENEKMISQEDE
jgi:hypothetical protein